MVGKKLKVYVGCALTSAPDDFIERIIALKIQLRNVLRVEILDFFGGKGKAGPGVTPEQVWARDIYECVALADAMLAICDLPSIGLGIEIEKAAGTRGIPTMIVAHHDVRISHLVLGIPYPCVQVQRYQTLDEVVVMLQEFLSWAGLRRKPVLV